MVESIVFYLLSGILVLSALMVVTHRNLFTCALYLASALSVMGGLFALLGADFLAAVQILLYVGGVIVILAFGVMLSSIQDALKQPQINDMWIPAAVACVTTLLVILVAIRRHAFVAADAARGATTESIGRLLLGDMVLPFEVVSLVLLASLVGAVIFSKKETRA